MKVYIETVGCKLNQFESQALAEALKKKSFGIAENIESSDFVLVNTCSVTQNADRKSRQIMKKAKKLGKKVIATGCYVTTDFTELKNAEFADLIVKNESKFSIPEFLEKHLSLEEKIPQLKKSSEFPIVHQFERTRAFVKIQDGCDKFCSYCKVPLARGRSRSLDPNTIINFIQKLTENGYKEIVLTGVNISDYFYRGINLFDLVKSILELPGNFRLRLSSLQPDEFDFRLIDLLKDPKMTNHFHLSLQSGSKDVLKRMNRHYEPSFFLSLIQQIRQVSPDCGITTDIIIGFPEETEKEFEETMNFLEEAAFTRVHAFSYSPRPHTKASGMKDIPQEIKKRRLHRLEEKAIEIGRTFIEKNILGKSYSVLIETRESGKYTGYTSNYLKIYSQKELRENEFYSLIPRSVLRNKNALELTE